MNKSTIFVIAFAMLLLLSACEGDNGVGAPGKYDAFANCLTEKGVKMYGAYWCSHCKSQKELFGASFAFVSYVECDSNGKNAKPEECIAAGIRGYPTWEINAQLYPGEQPFEKLAELSGCLINELGAA
jgi:hypothetical protein